MTRLLIILIFFLLYSPLVDAEHSGYNEAESAESNANCSAAFHFGCAQEEQTHTASSDGFAAPIGKMGSSSTEIAFLVFIMSVIILTRALQWRGYHQGNLRVTERIR